MYKTKAADGCNNTIHKKVKNFRLSQTPAMSKHQLACLLQLEGMDVDYHVIERIEAGQRFVTDVELKIIARVMKMGFEELLR